MSTRLKELNEQRGAKVKEASAIVEKARTEKRAFTAEENTKLDGLHTEADAIGQTIIVEARQLSLEDRRPVLSHTEQRDVARFDYGKLLRHLHRSAKGAGAVHLDGIEAEMIQEGETEARAAGVESAGLFLPRILVRGTERRDMTATGTTVTATPLDQGGMTIATGKASLLDDFFNASIMRQAGATVLEGLVGNLDVPRIVAGTAPAGKTENAAADEVTPTTAKMTLSPQRLPAYIDISEQLLKQSSSAIEAILRRHLTAQMTAVQEKAFFHGDGTDEADGIAGTSGIGSVVGGTNGAAPDWADIIDLETAVDTDNALLGNLHYASNGQIRGKLKKTVRVSSTDSRFILDGNDLNGYVPLFTNAISRTLTKGSSSVASAIFFGNFNDYWIGYWGGLSLELIRDKTLATTGMYSLVASAYYDGGVVRPVSFAAMLDALGA
jgi:HK97 family phage major capsid protein